MPYLGGALQEVLDAAIGLPLEKRRAEWLKSIGEALQELCDRIDGLTPEALGDNEEFVSVVATATEIALRNHQVEKLEALRNIVINTAAGFTIDDVLRNIFMDLVDRFSPLHIVVLRLHHSPASSPAIVASAKTLMAGSFSHLLKTALPNFKDSVLDQVDTDLVAAGLIDGGTKAMGTGQGLMASHTTERGKAFVRFISRNGKS